MAPCARAGITLTLKPRQMSVGAINKISWWLMVGLAVVGTGCSVRLGTKPWTEVWIDGHNTNSHTPYSEPIPCGSHEITFKRDDLGLTKSMTITLKDGETVKRSLVLQEEETE